MNDVSLDAARESATLVALLQTEYGVIYGLGAVGGQLAVRVPGSGPNPAPIVAIATDTYDQHRLRRDRLIAALRSRQASVPVPLAAYQVTRSDQPAVLANYLAELAQTTIVAYRSALASLADVALRTDAVAAVIEAAKVRTSALRTAGRSDVDAAPALPG